MLLDSAGPLTDKTLYGNSKETKSNALDQRKDGDKEW